MSATTATPLTTNRRTLWQWYDPVCDVVYHCHPRDLFPSTLPSRTSMLLMFCVLGSLSRVQQLTLQYHGYAWCARLLPAFSVGHYTYPQRDGHDEWLAEYGPQTVTHPSTNRARRRATRAYMLIETKTLYSIIPKHQAKPPSRNVVYQRGVIVLQTKPWCLPVAGGWYLVSDDAFWRINASDNREPAYQLPRAFFSRLILSRLCLTSISCHTLTTTSSTQTNDKLIKPFDAHCSIKHPVPDRVKPSFVIFDIRALWVSDAQPWASECPDGKKNYKRRLNPVWHRMLYSCTHGNSGVKGLKSIFRDHPRRWASQRLFSQEIHVTVTVNHFCRHRTISLIIISL